MNANRQLNGQRIKSTADTGEIATLAVCLIEDAELICSDDSYVLDVVKQEHYSYIDTAGIEHLIVTDSAVMFCKYCVSDIKIQRSIARKFYKSIIHSGNHQLIGQKLQDFDSLIPKSSI